MPIFSEGAGFLAVVVIYYLWRFYNHDRLRRQKSIVNQRLAFMVWVMATQEDSEGVWADCFRPRFPGRGYAVLEAGSTAGREVPR